jgi:hypothetical protein
MFRRLLFVLPIVAACRGNVDSDALVCVQAVDAGPDRAIHVGDAAPLDAGASNPCGDVPALYTWAFLRVPPGSAVEELGFGPENGTPGGIAVEITPDVPGAYVIGLTVQDATGTSNQDVVVLTAAGDEVAPTAIAGDDLRGMVGERVSLDGTASSDADGTALTYEWVFAAVPDGSALDERDLFDGDTATPSFLPDAAGTWVVALTVSDGIASSTPDFVAIDVTPDNRAPIAEAGSAFTSPPCAEGQIALDGRASYDPDGDALTYRWGLAAAPNGSTASDAGFDDRSSPSPRFAWDVPGNYAFWLDVDDGITTSPKDIVTVTATTVADNHPPVPAAGADFTYSIEADCALGADGERECAPCTTIRFVLDAGGTIDPDDDPLDFYWQADDPSLGLVIDSPSTGFTYAHSPDLPATFGETTRTHFVVTLSATDCASTATDSIDLIVSCKGVAP